MIHSRVITAAVVLIAAACQAIPGDPGTPATSSATTGAQDQAPAAVSTANLIAHWDFDQGSGTTIPAVGGNPAYAGTFSSTPTWTNGRFGSALRLDGTDYVAIPNMSEANGASAVTLAGWIKRRVRGSRVLLGKQSTNGTATLAIEAWDDGLVYFDVGTTAYAAGMVALNDTAWHHVALVFDGSLTGNSNRLKGYVDGVQRTLTWTGTIPSATTTSTNAFRLGTLQGDYSDGTIDDFWLFGRALSASEIQLLVAGPTTSQTAAVASVTVSPASATVAAGETVQLTATTLDAAGNVLTGRTVTWASANASVASVDASGLVTGVTAGGPVTITAASEGRSGQSSITVSAASPPPPPPLSSGKYPLAVGPTGRYLVDQAGEPFLLVGDAAWSLISQLSDADAETYLANRQQLGFNAVLVNLVEHKFADHAPADADGIAPFTGQAFATPNEAYFAHADAIIQSAQQKGIVVLLAPDYLGYQCGDEGWCAETQAATTTQMFAWGQYVGNRYKDYDNIVWVIGGDTDPTPVLSRMQAMVDGILSVDTRHPLTAHNASPQMAITPWGSASWLNVNSIYPSKTGVDYTFAKTAYNVSPAKPFFTIESWYDGEGPAALALRYETYGSVLSGGFGQVYGDCPMWNFNAKAASTFCTGSTWQAQLDNQGARNMKFMRLLFESRNWEKLVPDFNHAAITAGYGTFGGTDYVPAARGSDGSSIIAYLPTSRTVTVNGSGLSGGSMLAWWYNPGTGAVTSIGTYSTSSPVSVTPPGSGDWVLVVDGSTFAFGAPGGGPVPPPAPVATVTVSPNPGNVTVGQGLQLSATTRDANGNLLTGRAITWTTSNPSMATVSSSGLVTGVAAGGPVTITATSEGKSGTSSVTVAQVAVASVTLSPNPGSVTVGQALQLTATTRDASGNVLTGRAVAWTSSNPSLATVNATGLVTGIAAGGPVTITATSEGKSGTSSVTVALVPVATVTVSPNSGSVAAGQTLQLSATTRDASGNVLTGRVVTWATSNPSVATVNASGLVTGIAAGGPVTITATSEGRSGTSSITVAAGTASAITFVQATARKVTTSSATFTLPAAAMQGDLIVVGLDFAATAFVSISDNRGNTYTQVGSEIMTPGGARTRLYYAKNITGGLTSITVTLAASTPFLEVYGAEYRGANPVDPIEAYAQKTGTGSTVSSGSLVTTNPNDLLLAYCVGDYQCTVGSGFTARSTFNSNLLEDRALSTAGTFAATASSTSGWSIIAAAIRR